MIIPLDIMNCISFLTYRAQFNNVIRTSSYDELLRKLRSRAEEVRQ